MGNKLSWLRGWASPAVSTTDSNILECVQQSMDFLALVMKALATTHPTTQYHIPEDLILQQHCCENLKSHTVNFLFTKEKQYNAKRDK